MAREKGFSWNEKTCAAAAAGGHFEVLKWARHNECPWGGDKTTFVGFNGNFEILKWARDNGCP